MSYKRCVLCFRLSRRQTLGYSMEVDMDLANQIKDLEFLLRREKLESKTKIKEILYQILELQEGVDRLLEIAKGQDWPDVAKEFTQERFGLMSKKCLQIVQRAGAVQVNSLGQPINEEYHEVIDKVVSRDAPLGQIVKVEREGYMYEGDVLRMAKVIIATDK